MKVAIIGTAAHCVKAPFNDPSWEIWACSVGVPPRWDRWFELHSDDSIDTYPGHRERLQTAEKPIYMRRAEPGIPYSIEYPLNQMVAKYGTWFFTSTIAYEMALAIEMPGVTDIGLWGVDLAHQTEYATQKPGVRFFIQVAKLAGINVTMPPEAEVGTPGRLYCYDDGKSLLEAKIGARLAELLGRQGEVQKNREDLAAKRWLLQGALDERLKAAPADLIREHLKAVVDAEAQAERDYYQLDGAVQNATHMKLNWTGA